MTPVCGVAYLQRLLAESPDPAEREQIQDALDEQRRRIDAQNARLRWRILAERGAREQYDGP